MNFMVYNVGLRAHPSNTTHNACSSPLSSTLHIGLLRPSLDWYCTYWDPWKYLQKIIWPIPVFLSFSTEYIVYCLSTTLWKHVMGKTVILLSAWKQRHQWAISNITFAECVIIGPLQLPLPRRLCLWPLCVCLSICYQDDSRTFQKHVNICFRFKYDLGQKYHAPQV